MQADIKGNRAFSYLDVVLEPGEQLIASSRAIFAFDNDLIWQNCFKGGFWRAFLARCLSGEPLFVARIVNSMPQTGGLALAHTVPGEIVCAHLHNHSLCLRSDAFIAATPGIKINLEYAGFTSWFAKEGLFRTCISGSGTLWFGAAGVLQESDIDRELVIANHRLVSYDASLRLKHQLQGSFLSRLFGGNGVVTRIQGAGKVVTQMQSVAHTALWIDQG